MGAAPTTFCVKGKCSTVELQTLKYEKRALSPLYKSRLKNIRVYCLALPPTIAIAAVARTVVVVLAAILVVMLPL